MSVRQARKWRYNHRSRTSQPNDCLLACVISSLQIKTQRTADHMFLGSFTTYRQSSHLSSQGIDVLSTKMMLIYEIYMSKSAPMRTYLTVFSFNLAVALFVNLCF